MDNVNYSGEQVVSGEQACRMLRVHINTLRRWAAEGKIERCTPLTRGHWFFRRRDVEALCQKYEIQVPEGTIVWKVKITSPQRLSYISPSVSTFLGYTASEALATQMQNAFSHTSLGRMGKAMAEELPGLFSGERPDPAITLDLELVHKDGRNIPVTANFSCVRDARGSPVEIMAVARVKTARPGPGIARTAI